MTDLEINLLEALQVIAHCCDSIQKDNYLPSRGALLVGATKISRALTLFSIEGNPSPAFDIILEAYWGTPTYGKGAQIIEKMLEELKDD